MPLRTDIVRFSSNLRVFKHVFLTGLMLRDRCSPSPMANSSLISTVPQILASHVTNAIANFVIMDLQPPALVEGEGFRQLFHTILPSHKELPSACLLENLLKDHHAKGNRSLARMMKRTTESGEESFDHTAPLEFETFGQPSTYHSEPPYFVTFSVDIWFHSWQGHTELYLTLWAHYIDFPFTFHNVALETLRLKEHSFQGVETQVKAIAQAWRIFQPNALVLGGGRERAKSRRDLRGPRRWQSVQQAFLTQTPPSFWSGRAPPLRRNRRNPRMAVRSHLCPASSAWLKAASRK